MGNYIFASSEVKDAKLLWDLLDNVAMKVGIETQVLEAPPIPLVECYAILELFLQDKSIGMPHPIQKEQIWLLFCTSHHIWDSTHHW